MVPLNPRGSIEPRLRITVLRKKGSSGYEKKRKRVLATVVTSPALRA